MADWGGFLAHIEEISRQQAAGMGGRRGGFSENRLEPFICKKSQVKTPKYFFQGHLGVI